MESEWTVSETEPIPRWKVGPRIWRGNHQWRLRLYRPWNRKRFVEVQSDKFIVALYILGVAANWWEDTVDWKAE